MSIELRQAAQQALKALEAISDEMTVGERYTNAGQYLLEALGPLRAALSQQPATTEPVGYLYDFKYDDEIARGWFTQNIDEIQFRPATCLNIRPLYAHPAPSVPDDAARNAERYRWLRKTRFIWSDFSYISGVHPTVVGLEFQWFPTQTKKPTSEDLDAAIDAAMLADKVGGKQ